MSACLHVCMSVYMSAGPFLSETCLSTVPKEVTDQLVHMRDIASKSVQENVPLNLFVFLFSVCMYVCIYHSTFVCIYIGQ